MNGAFRAGAAHTSWLEATAHRLVAARLWPSAS
jgi:hypothetical protein